MDKHFFLNEFPELKDKIQELKASDAHFKKLYEDYNETNHQVERIENGIEPADDHFLNELRMKRVKLKDELYEMVKSER
ncbi:DUF465 domain-containing protein [Flavihumibacter sp. RY-1]|uniref:DUF465 domain-containing protein n=1 Tax=Flavihumibacter fluminis TaxID=2909236 RepID=A0ABS9BIS7_9BACT|nr:DUF465 domain-containing protein [Flavihumibacter fluminis]MCF1714997.1 DUF465 domain-containing protein [Flavihumibacter fluminis]